MTTNNGLRLPDKVDDSDEDRKLVAQKLQQPQ